MAYVEKNPIPGGDSKYLTINVIARRAKELARTKKATIPYAEDAFEPVDVAAEEFFAGNLRVQVRDEITGEISDFEGMA